MTLKSLKTALTAKELTIGSWLTLADTDICEMMSQFDFDWLAIDTEHSSIGLREMSRMIQVIDLAGTIPIVRVGSNDPLLIKHALDSGAHGIIVPMINTPEDAQSAVAAAHYPPRGQRGVGLYRAQSYGTNFKNYKEWCETEIVVIAQIEHRIGAENLQNIMNTDGIDGFLVGPYDLSGSYGKPGKFNDPDVKKSLGLLQNYCRFGRKPGGYHVVHTADGALETKIDEGYQFIAYGTDMIFITEKLEAERRLVKKLLSKRAENGTGQ
jgi:2-keto-3-deoxy-L-rhamnonate aldolase RhmA